MNPSRALRNKAAGRHNIVNAYDYGQAISGFERTISITTHLLLNGKVITQSPAKKGFEIYIAPIEEGSVLTKLLLGVGGGVGSLAIAAGVAPPNTAFGWLAKSAVEYVIEESLGFEPNFDETLGNQIERYRRQETRTAIVDGLTDVRFDSVIEKVEGGLRDAHRPIVKSGTSELGAFEYKIGAEQGSMAPYLSHATFDYIDRTITPEDFSLFEGNVSSYNANTFRGRLYHPESQRTVPFEIADEIQTAASVDQITSSLRANGAARFTGFENRRNDIGLRALRNESVSGRVKSLYVIEIYRP